MPVKTGDRVTVSGAGAAASAMILQIDELAGAPAPGRENIVTVLRELGVSRIAFITQMEAPARLSFFALEVVTRNDSPGYPRQEHPAAVKWFDLRGNELTIEKET